MSVKSRRRWTLLTIVVIGLPVFYVASFGPACSAVERGWIAPGPISRVYRPLLTWHERCYDDIQNSQLKLRMADGYLSLWTSERLTFNRVVFAAGYSPRDCRNWMGMSPETAPCRSDKLIFPAR